MLTDALSAEAYKLWRNRTALFWGFLFMPLLALAIGLAVEVYFRGAVPRSGVVQTTDLARATLKAIGDAGSPLTQMALLIGGAAVFGGEYRWETWRLFTPRNSRANLMLAKALVVAGAAAASVLLIALAGAASGLIGAAARHAPISWNDGAPAEFAARLAGLFVISWLQVLQPVAIGALAAVATRSVLAALVVPIALGSAQALLMTQLGPAELWHPPLWALTALPGVSVELLRAAVAGAAVTAAKTAAAAAALCAWVVLPVAATLALFERQELSRE